MLHRSVKCRNNFENILLRFIFHVGVNLLGETVSTSNRKSADLKAKKSDNRNSSNAYRGSSLPQDSNSKFESK